MCFWPLQHSNPHFCVLILRWFSMHYGAILHDFSDHLCKGIVSFDFFTRPRKKRHTLDDLWVTEITLRASASTPKRFLKITVLLSVDAFGGVRNGDIIQGAGLYLFFHVVQYSTKELEIFSSLYFSALFCWTWQVSRIWRYRRRGRPSTCAILAGQEQREQKTILC